MSNRSDPTHKLATKRDATTDAVAELPNEVTAGGRRRRWSSADKSTIVAESMAPGANATEVARRHGLNRGQLYAWRRALADSAAGVETVSGEQPKPARMKPTGPKSSSKTDKGLPAFAQVVMATPTARSPASEANLVEVAIGDVSVRVQGAVDVEGLVAVLNAVRRVA